MVGALRIGLGVVLIPLAVFALFLLTYGVFNPAHWITELSPSGKALTLATLALSGGIGTFMLRTDWLARRPCLAASLLAAAIIELGFVLPGIYRSLGQF